MKEPEPSFHFHSSLFPLDFITKLKEDLNCRFRKKISIQNHWWFDNLFVLSFKSFHLKFCQEKRGELMKWKKIMKWTTVCGKPIPFCLDPCNKRGNNSLLEEIDSTQSILGSRQHNIWRKLGGLSPHFGRCFLCIFLTIVCYYYLMKQQSDLEPPIRHFKTSLHLFE